MAAEAISGDTLKLDDGRTAHLAGVKGAGDETKAILQSLINHHELILEGASLDRYGRISADIYTKPDRTWLQGEMLRQGAAFVYPPTGNEPHLDTLLTSEQAARSHKRGIWNAAPFVDLPADQPRLIHYGSYAFVRGTIVKAERVKNKVYLNFGPDWRTDFTAAIAAHDLHLFRKAGQDPLDLEGKIVRVRGWVIRDAGPMITLTHPSQMQILGETPVKP